MTAEQSGAPTSLPGQQANAGCPFRKAQEMGLWLLGKLRGRLKVCIKISSPLPETMHMDPRSAHKT